MCACDFYVLLSWCSCICVLIKGGVLISGVVLYTSLYVPTGCLLFKEHVMHEVASAHTEKCMHYMSPVSSFLEGGLLLS